MTTSRRRLLQAGAATGATLLLSACGSRGSSSGPEPAGPPRQGGTLRVGAPGSVSSITRDPHGTQNNDSDYLILSLIYDTLTVPGKSPNVAPRLATRWESSPDLRTWRFEIAEGARFHDGSPVTSADVVWSLRRLRRSASGKSRLPGIDEQGIRADGQRSVIVESHYPNSQMPVQMRLATFVTKDGVTNPADTPGTGPFKLDWYRDGNARLVRNDDWYGGAPLLDAIEVRMFDRTEAMANAVFSEEIDLASNVGTIPARTAEQRSGIQVVRRPDDTALAVVMRASEGPFADLRVRDAFRYAVDRRAMVDRGLSGYGSVGNDIMGTGDPLYAREIPQREQDLQRANELLDEAGFDRSASYELKTTDEIPGLNESAALFAKQAQRIGVKIDVVKQEMSTFLGDSKGEAPLYTTFWGTNDSTYASASKLLLSTASANEAKWRDPEFDAAYRAMISTSDPQQHRRFNHEMQRIQHERSGYLVWGIADGLDIAKDTVQDLPTLPGYGRVLLERTWLSG